MSKVKASTVEVKVGGVSIAGLADCSLSLNTITDDTRTKENSGPVHAFNYVDWSMSGNGILGAEDGTKVDISAMQTAAKSGSTLALTFVVGGTVKVQGNAMIDNFSITAPVDGKATYDVSFKGIGALTIPE